MSQNHKTTYDFYLYIMISVYLGPAHIQVIELKNNINCICVAYLFMFFIEELIYRSDVPVCPVEKQISKRNGPALFNIGIWAIKNRKSLNSANKTREFRAGMRNRI